MEKKDSSPLYVFLDESGNFDFSPNGTKHFVISALTVQRPFPWEDDLLSLRYDLLGSKEFALDPEIFHATEDLQPVRNKVFEVIEKHLSAFRVDSIIVEKAKTHPSLWEPERFYPKVLGFLLQYVFRGTQCNEAREIVVITDSVPVKKKRQAIEKGVKKYLAEMISVDQKYSIYHIESKSCPSLQVIDYINWAIFKKWRDDDIRSYEKISKAIKSEFDIFKTGNRLFY